MSTNDTTNMSMSLSEYRELSKREKENFLIAGISERVESQARTKGGIATVEDVTVQEFEPELVELFNAFTRIAIPYLRDVAFDKATKKYEKQISDGKSDAKEPVVYAGVHSVYGSFNSAFREAFPVVNPIDATNALRKAKMLVVGRAQKGAYLILPEDSNAKELGERTRKATAQKHVNNILDMAS
jgi:hypothetical protein